MATTTSVGVVVAIVLAVVVVLVILAVGGYLPYRSAAAQCLSTRTLIDPLYQMSVVELLVYID